MNREHERFSVGVDVVSVHEVRDAVRTFGDRYLTRLFTAHELDCAAGGEWVMAQHLAARFAAKEAAIKALRPTDCVPEWRSIEVRRDGRGRPALHLTGSAAEAARRARFTTSAVSLTHEGGLAAAVVVLA